MTISDKNPYKNQVLHGMRPDDLALLAPHLSRVELNLRDRLESRQAPIQHVFFIEKGLASIVAKVPKGRDTEVGIIGIEGFSAMSLVMGDSQSPHECFMQVPGYAMRISADLFRDAVEKSPTLHFYLLRFVQAMWVQCSYTALANARAKVEERLARWILMCHDRLDGDELPITHEFLSIMLGVRRPGVTVALQILEGKGLIRSTRGLVTMRDRRGLEIVADGTYSEPEAEYARLMNRAPVGSDMKAFAGERALAAA